MHEVILREKSCVCGYDNIDITEAYEVDYSCSLFCALRTVELPSTIATDDKEDPELTVNLRAIHSVAQLLCGVV